MRPIQWLSIAGLFVLLLSACREKDPVTPDIQSVFHLNIWNHYSPVEARCAAFISDADGKTIAFQWLPANDSIHLSAPNSFPTDRFDCTLVIIREIVTATGVDTSVTLRTFTQLRSSTDVHALELFYQITTDINIQLSGFNSLDTLVVPEGLPFLRPEASNNYTGLYRALHSGKVWLRFKTDGQNAWHYQVIDDPAALGSTLLPLDASTLPSIDAPVQTIQMPFTASWEYHIDGVLNLNAAAFLPLGDFLRSPGGYVFTTDKLDIWEPQNAGFNAYRIKVRGNSSGQNTYTYIRDALYAHPPSELPNPAFSMEQVGTTTGRTAAVQCAGVFALVQFTHEKTGSQRYIWETIHQAKSGLLSYTLPDVPEALASEFPNLGNYAFDVDTRVKGSAFDQSNVYDITLGPWLLSNDPLWRAKMGELAIEKTLQ